MLLLASRWAKKCQLKGQAILDVGHDYMDIGRGHEVGFHLWLERSLWAVGGTGKGLGGRKRALRRHGGGHRPTDPTPGNDRPGGSRSRGEGRQTCAKRSQMLRRMTVKLSVVCPESARIPGAEPEKRVVTAPAVDPRRQFSANMMCVLMSAVHYTMYLDRAFAVALQGTTAAARAVILATGGGERGAARADQQGHTGTR